MLGSSSRTTSRTEFGFGRAERKPTLLARRSIVCETVLSKMVDVDERCF